jgi:hypothetical protein
MLWFADLLKVNHQLESRVREIRLPGSEGGAPYPGVPTPIHGSDPTTDPTYQAPAQRATMLKHPGQSLVAATPRQEIFGPVDPHDYSLCRFRLSK